MRDRYRAELSAEEWSMTPREQAGHAWSVLLHAGELHRALVETGVLAVPHSPLWCRLHMRHRWHVALTEDGERYRRCQACGMDDDETSRRRVAGSMVSAHGVVQY